MTRDLPPAMDSILAIESRETVRQALRAVLLRRGYRLGEAGDPASAVQSLDLARPHLVILGRTENGATESVEFSRTLRRSYPSVPLLFFAPDSCEELAIAALKAGARDYIKQPSYDELADAVDLCLRRPKEPPSPGAADSLHGSQMVGQSLALLRTRTYLSKVAAADCNVLITGETGTGKELAAAAIHHNSSRRNKPFVTINCAAIPNSLLESELFGFERGAFTGAVATNCGKLMQAQGGTVFLDEIGEMDLHGQAKILRAIENGEVQRLGEKNARAIDVRIVAATNQNLEQAIVLNTFRRDLYFRLNVTQIHLPPLRERLEDVPVLVDFFIRKLNQRWNRRVKGLTPELMDGLMLHSWPGNVRELKNLMEALFVNDHDGWIGLQDLPDRFNQVKNDGLGRPEEERITVLRALQATSWNKSKAAEALSWSRMTLYRKMAQYRIVATNRTAR